MDIEKLQNSWGKQIIELGLMSQKEQEKNIRKRLSKMYAYETSKVCFKPTMKDDIKKYKTLEGAVDYFFGCEGKKGFLGNKWTEIVFHTNEVIEMEECIISNGHYFFNKPRENVYVKAFYTMAFDKSGRLIIHHSSLPVES